MFRWLKGRRRQKTPASKAPDSEYGFNEENLGSKDYHIYEEISDLHFQCDREPRRNGDFKGEFQSQDGPYMVVNIPEPDVRARSDAETTVRSRASSVFACALTGRRNSSMSGNTETSSSGVDLTYDLSDSQRCCPVDVSHLSSDSFAETGEHRPIHCGDYSLLASSDTGCEYDVSTSSDGDPTNYELQLARIEQNLAHKCKIREIIQQVTPVNEESDSESMTTVSSLSMTSQIQGCHLVSKTYSDDEGALADYSESENSSGYYETEFRMSKTRKCDLVKLAGTCRTCVRHSRADQTRYSDTPCSQCTALSCAGLSEKSSRGEQRLRQNISRSSHHKQTLSDSNRSKVPLTVSIPKHKHHSTAVPKTKSRRQVRDLNSGRCKSKTSSLMTEAHTDKHNSVEENTSLCRLSCSVTDLQTDSIEQLSNTSNRTHSDQQATQDAEEYEYTHAYSADVCDIRTRKSFHSNKIAKSRNFDSVDIYKSRASNNRLLSDLIINNYHERQLLFG